MLDVKNKKVTVMGFGRSGVAAARLLLEQGAKVTISDIKSKVELAEGLKTLAGFEFECETGGHKEETLRQSDLIIVAPGIPLSLPVLKKARETGVPIFGEIELAYHFCAAPILAVTGTKGKTTTCSWTGEMLRKSGIETAVAGNIGNLAFSAVASRMKPSGWVVLEVSSFQLEGTVEFNPKLCAITNITADHLDRYENIQQYVEAKALILRNQKKEDVALLNQEDKYTPLLASQAKGKVLYFSREKEVSEGACLKDKTMVLRLKGKEYKLVPAAALSLRGPHNIENGLVASTLAFLASADPAYICESLQTFKGVEHRLEFVSEVKGVSFYNNSQGTNIDAVAKSLLSFEEPLHVIMGGRDKGADFTALRDLVSARVKTVLVLGEAKEKIRQSLQGATRLEEVQDLAEAVRKAFGLSRPGEVVLLSPACASFDMFKSYEERGQVFKQEVFKLKKEEER